MSTTIPPRFRTRALGGLLVYAALTACGGEGAEPATGPNLLLVVVDTLRADHLGTYGHGEDTSPRIDELAGQGVVFERMYSQAPWTKPSVASLFTSLYPPQHQVLEEGTDNRLASSLTTLAEVLADAGYRTGAVSQNPHIQANTGFDQGFGEFHGLSGYVSGVDEMLDAGRGFLDREAGRPFFLYMHFLDPHGPYAPPPKLRKRFLGERETKKARVVSGRVGKMLEGEELSIELEAGDLDYLEALYDAEIRWVDVAVGRLLDHLEERGLADDTVVLLTADHGEEFMDHGTLKHGYQLYEESVHVPLIVRAPGVEPRRVDRMVAQHVDLAPTVLDLLGQPVPSAAQGRSLRPWLEGRETAGPETALLGTSWREIDRFAVREGSWKLVRHADQGRTELYDLASDPTERKNVAGDHPDVVERLSQAYTDATSPIDGVTPDDAFGARDPELERRLRAIGYTGGEEDEHEH